MSVLYSFACCILVVTPIEAARILAVFPAPSISHQVVFRPLTQELAKRGHDVTVITTDPVFTKGEAHPNLTEIDVHDISYKIWHEQFSKAEKGKQSNWISQMEIIFRAFALFFDAQIRTDSIQKLIYDKSKQFDLLLIEACVRPAISFSYVYKNVPVILVSSLGATPGNYDVIGAADHPLLYPTMSRRRLNNLGLWEKVTELYGSYETSNMYERVAKLEDKLLQHYFGPEIPSVKELLNNVDMLFLNINPIFGGIRPVPPTVIYLGGIHQLSAKELPDDLKSYLDSAKEGAIYISFGSNVVPSQLTAERIQTLVRVFSRLPYDVLWKWDKDELPGRTGNIRISKWLPQSDLLRHPKVKLFITQGGLQSTDEAITAGVPLLGFPMLSDQWFNVEKYVSLKIGARLDFDTFTEDTLKNAITTIIKDASYRRNIEKLRNLMRDEPMRPLERAVWWTEYVLRHGGARHLRAPAANMSWAQYLELELVLTLLICLLAAIAVFLSAIYLLYKYLTRNVKVKRN